MPVLRVAHEAQRKDQVRLAALALRRLRGQRDPFHRHRGARPGRLRRLAAFQGIPGRYARAGPHVQAQVRAVLGDMADAGGRRRGLPRRLRRRHMGGERLRGADSLQRRVRAVVAPRARRDHRGVEVSSVARGRAGGGGDRRRQRLRGRRRGGSCRRASSCTAWPRSCCI